MKKRWLAAIMAMILAVSPVAAQTVDASQSNVIMADMMESQRDSLVGDEIDTASLETGETATSPYEDTDADPTKSYEYTITGDDGSVAVVEVPAVLEKLYTRCTPDFSKEKPVKDDTYVIVGANTGVSNNKKASDWVIIRDGNSLKYQKIDSYLTDTPRVIETALDNSEWDFTYQTTSNGVATYIIGKDGSYLNVGSGATISTNSSALNVISNSYYAESVSIGTGATNATTYLNFSVNHDTVQLWSTDGGSAWYLYGLDYKITEAAVAAATADVTGTAEDYTEDSWNVYQTALANCGSENVYDTDTAALEKYNALVAAVDGLEEKAQEVPEEPDTPEVLLDLEPTFVKITPKTTDSGIVIEDGIYVIVGAYDYYYNGNSNKALNSDTSITYTNVASYVSGATLTQTDPAYEWKITAVSGGYTIEAVDGDGYLNITSDNSQNGVTVGENEQVVTIVKNNRSATAVAIGAPMNNRVAYVNARRSDGAGTWYDNDGGSALDLYQKTYKIPMETLYAEICKANGGQFLYSEECYTAEAGIRYRDALKAARQTFATEDAAEEALAELIASVKNLQKNTIAESCFPVMTWGATVDRNRTVDNPDTADVDETTLPNYVPRLAFLDTDGYDPDLDDPDNVTFDRFEALTWKWSEIARLVNDEDERISPVWGQADNGMFARRFSVRSSEETNDWQHANVYKIAGQFAWPEGYKLSETTIVLDSTNDFFYRDIYEYISENDLSDTFPLGQVLPINDDVYVVMWAETEENKEESRPTVDNINDYLAFWSGTSGKGVWTKNGSTQDDWGRDEPGTFIEWNLQGERAFYQSFPNKIGTGETKEDGTAYTNSDGVNLTSDVANYLSHTEQWYTLTDTSSINSVMRANYTDEEIKPGTIVHLDLYVMNNSGSGYLDELEIELFKEKETETTVTVNYYLNAVSKDGFLGSEPLLNQEYGSKITLVPGTRSGQLNSYKKEAIYQAGYRDVTDGVQQGTVPYVVTEGIDNVINVVYTVKSDKIVYLTAPSATYVYDANETRTLNTVTVTEKGFDGEAELVSGETDKYLLQDGNYILYVKAEVSASNPGIYDNPIIENPDNPIKVIERIENEDGSVTEVDVTNSYTIVKVPGELKITYEPVDVTYTYDFGVKNVYANAFTEVEKLAPNTLKLDGSPEMDFKLSDGEVYYTPSAADTGDSVVLQLRYAGSYVVEKTFNFVPATNVLYEEDFVREKPNKVTDETTGEKVDEVITEPAWEVVAAENTRVVDDNETTVYGYSAAYAKDSEYSNGSVMRATLEMTGNYVETARAASFSFTGTGFDLISACGTDTGMLLVKVTDPSNKAKFHLVDTYFTGDETLINGTGTLAHQVPILRQMNLPYGEYQVDVWGYLANTSGAGAATYGMRNRMSVTTDDIIMAALDSAGLLDEVDVADVEVSFIDENSSLNGGTGCVTGSGIATFGLTREGGATAGATTAYVYIDGFRVYGASQDETNYVANEKGLQYASVYDFAQNSATDIADGYLTNSLVYVEYDGATNVAAIAKYKNQGPQNEVYLTQNNAIGLVLENYVPGMTVMVSAKAVSNGAILGVMNDIIDSGFVALGDNLAKTEMYYDVSNYIVQDTYTGDFILALTNKGTGILAVSGIKLDKGIEAVASADIGDVVNDALEENNAVADFIPKRFEVTYNTVVESGRTTNISVKTSVPVKINGEVDAEETVDKVVLCSDKNGTPAKDAYGNVIEFSYTNKKAVDRGRASYCSFDTAVYVDESVTYYVIAYNVKGEASDPLEVKITAQ